MTKREFKVGDRVSFPWGRYRYRGTVSTLGESSDVWVEVDDSQGLGANILPASFSTLRRLVKKPKEKSVNIIVCNHPGCCCVCGHRGKCPEDGPSLISDVRE